MLFNSYIFIFGFLPLAFALTYLAGRYSQPLAKVALAALSLGFYAWWRPIHLPLLLFSIVFNYVVGGIIQRARDAGRERTVRAWLIFGLLVDVGMLGWFKYANFVGENVSALLGVEDTLPHIILPLAISFFTFQKIAYLIDSARGDARKMSFLDFTLFAAFFPQLIAGPIVHYKEVVPQIQRRLFGRLIWRNVLVGLSIFAIGLFKKTVIADTLAAEANKLFALSAAGHAYDMSSAWLAALLYTFQLYFDFSGYSDMAIGLGRIFGVKLPLNFHSPLRAASIIDYWRRWHMTLQRFIVAYIFQPLSVPLNRLAAEKGLRGWPAFAVAIGIPTFVTFVAVGIWHGAGWTFVVFGVMHAIYISANEAWRERKRLLKRKRRKEGRPLGDPGLGERLAYHALTLMAVIFANVMFRAATVGDAATVWSGMIGLNGLSLAWPAGVGWGAAAALVLSVGLTFVAPNTQQIMARFDPAENAGEWRGVAKPPVSWTWKPDTMGLVYVGLVLIAGVLAIQRGRAIFLYFNF
jgi:D-alanyl-lipoteichoic acid acyltransferase DltB (MBOAT superfamily)